MLVRFLRWVPFLLLACALRMSAQDARELVKRAIELNRYGLTPPRDYTFVRTDKRITEDKQGQIETDSRSYEVVNLYGEPVERLVAVNGSPLEGEALQREKQRYEKRVAELKKRSPELRAKDVAKAEAEVRKQQAFLQEIPDAYELKLTGSEAIDGRDAWVIEANPKKNAKVKTGGRERNLLRLTGKIWIDKQDGQWIRAEASAPKNLDYGLFLARVKPGSVITFEQVRLQDGVWLPSRVAGRLKARVLVVPLDIRTETEYADYKKFGAETKVVFGEEAR